MKIVTNKFLLFLPWNLTHSLDRVRIQEGRNPAEDVRNRVALQDLADGVHLDFAGLVIAVT